MVLIVAMVIIVSFLITLYTEKRFGQTAMMFMLKYFDDVFTIKTKFVFF